MERDRGFIRRHPKTTAILGLIAASSSFAGVKYGDEIVQAGKIVFGADPGDLPPETPDVDPRTATVMCFEEAPNCDTTNALAIYYGEGNQIPLRLDEMNRDIINATIAVEDERFLTRIGPDYKALARSAAANVRAGGIVQGGSTITEQVVSNNYREDDPTFKAIEANKAKNAVIEAENAANPDLVPQPLLPDEVHELSADIRIESRLWEIGYAQKLDKLYAIDGDGDGIFEGKYTILEKYLNVVNYGRGARGVGAASWAYYNMPNNQLNTLQNATIAGIPQSPDGYDGSVDYDRDQAQRAKLVERRNHVLDTMADNNYISREEAENLKSQPLDIEPYQEFHYGPTNDLTVANTLGARYFIDYTKQRVEDTLGYDDTEFRSGKVINTTLSYLIQGQIPEAISSSPEPAEGAALAVIAMKPDGSIVAMDGGDYETMPNLALSNQPGGSADKIYVAATALALGTATLETVYEDSSSFTWPAANNGEDWTTTGGDHCPTESCNGYEAFPYSSNPYFLNMAYNIGPNGMADMDRLMDALGAPSPTAPSPAAVLGARETSVLGRTTAIASLIANHGSSVTPYVIKSVYTREGDKLVEDYSFSPTTDPVVDRSVSDQITEALRGTPQFGTASRQLSPLTAKTDIAGKTGTDGSESGTGNDSIYIANYYGVSCIAPTDGSQPYNLSIGVAERYADGLRPLGKGHTGGYLPAMVYGKIIDDIIGQPCRIN